ncbi:hypothetical protein N8H69_20115 [Achromobacter spanius]|uniref:T6SS effector BTH_I2691 family protein n=1 Tax=Achromobacter spanius TaxID=217203 RepID=UPI0022277475|nr:T6SS effector BTH_I2691 family protein [Achromobacter spanius]MCW3154860.1 hypothetical protein [Achromobacter spanius]
MDTFTNQIRVALQEASAVPAGACRTCERGGMPIMLLREAPLPPSSPFNPDQDRPGIDIQSGKYRVLRQGYVYVLLDQEIWHAYQVSADGYLRQYDPYRMPKGTAKPLSKACTAVGHDVRASFIHLDTKVYKEAWIAFSQDRWPEQVLHAYKAQRAPSTRFLKVDLATLRDTPNTLLHGLNYADGFLTDHVWEYRYDGHDFGSRHAVQLRTHRIVPLNEYVDSARKTQSLPQGVPVLALPDPVGAVLEFNQQRHILIQERLAWASNAERQYLLFTSAALVQIKELEKTWAQAQAVEEVQKEIEYRKQHNDHPVLGMRAYLPPVDVPRETEKAAKRITADYHKRLEQRYSEPRRKQFQDAHDKEWQRRQGLIDVVGKRYAEWLLSDAWQRIAQHDYSADDSYSAAGYTKMVAACLDGGPSETPPDTGGELGPTQKLWKALLEDPNSILYKALLAKNASLLAGLRPTFTEGFQANDSGKLYAAIKDLMMSQEGEIFLRSTVKEAVGQLQGAMTNAMLAMEARVQEQLVPVAATVHQAALLLCERVQLLRVEIELTLGEYQDLLTKQMRQGFDEAVRETGKQARALIFSGMLTLPGPAQNQIFKATFWIADTAAGLKEKLSVVSNATANALDGSWRSLEVAVGSLEPGAIAIAGQLKTTALDAKLLAHTALVGMRGFANLELVLSMGALFFQQDGLTRSLQDLDRVMGAQYPEAVAGVAASAVGVMGVGIEATGVGIRSVAQALQKAGIAEARAVNALTLGKGLIRFGGVTSALSGVVEGVQFGFAAYRNHRSGDELARDHYVGAGALAIISGGAAGATAYYTLSSLFGPLGIAIVTGLAAYALSQRAEHLQSDALEQWCRRCYFGVHNEIPPVWWNSAKTQISIPRYAHSVDEIAKSNAANNDRCTAVGALNAAILGMEAMVTFVANPRPTLAIHSKPPIGSEALVYRIGFPRWNGEQCAYAMYVRLQTYKGDHIAVAERCNVPASNQVSKPQQRPSYLVDDNATRLPSEQEPMVAGALALAFLDQDIKSATVWAKFWPNKDETDLYAELSITTHR